MHDREGTPYPPDAAPRDLRVTLDLEAPTAPRADALLLLRGVYGAAFAEQLGTRSLPERVRAEALPFTLEAARDALALTPVAPLLGGEPYTLLLRGASARAFPLQISDSPALGASVVALLPADGARDVPPNLSRALVQLDGEVDADDVQLAAHVRLYAPDQSLLPTQLERMPCEVLGLGAGTCIALAPRVALQPRQPHRLAVEPGLHGLNGAPIAAASSSFESADAEDRSPPTLTATACDVDELALGPLCVLLGDAHFGVRASLSEPALVTLAAPPAQWSAVAGGRSFALPDLPRADASQLLLRLRDLAGNVRDATLALPAPPALAPISIDEVRVDPRGREPAQEYVELLNSGAHPVSLMGFTLSTDGQRARTLAGEVVLAPGARVLVVAPSFAADDVQDGPLPSGIDLARLDAALSLANAGEAVQLRDAAGRRLSAAPALAPLLAGQCIARRGADPRSGAAGQFARDPDGHCTPGRATFAP